MAFTATIKSLNPVVSDDSNMNISVEVLFADSATGFNLIKTYVFPFSTTQATAVATITADGTAYKNNLANVANLQSKVGTVLTI